MKTCLDFFASDFKVYRFLLYSAIGVASLAPELMAWQEPEPIPGITQTREGETSFITVEEIIEKQRGYILHAGIKYHLLIGDITKREIVLGNLCEMLYLSNTPFQSYFYRGIPEDVKCITVQNVLCVDGANMTAYKQIAVCFDKVTGAFRSVKTVSPVAVQARKCVYISKSHLYLYDYFCDMARMTNPSLHWVDAGSKIKYQVIP